ncbi:hypothetical protein G7B40_011440 [Aetokthonos hydrillicola Thurmond2011]|jgi:hypothetical protein|uniref:Uncharacterized protein n=1 Tax=Aetokthonos hydrillicola Thurmond2011 TaxID=2712845 RepID=A0AAP5M4U4_9CYAN|nr:hypothetical protein [Aetokthonos hydrillicola]MBO3460035.1 hypothetical protein [Aetokthonos hydrillicola CCALA 1050]MBW4584632.1 hypothetical protein [Aetokthonos hydrillicola CCALA 1050]MDR9895176.1 hypothetical protein [Aetokthonos hydrillicola Thurmond2011]
MKLIISNLDLALLSLYWLGGENDTVIVLRGDGKLLSQDFAERLVDLAWDKIARFCASRGYKCAYLYAESQNNHPKRYSIPAELAVEAMIGDSLQNNEYLIGSSVEPETTVEPETILTIPEEELSIGWLERSPLPTYINAIRTQCKFYANPKALATQGKPPEDFLNGNAYDLNDPDELDRRTSLIAAGERLRNYEYEGWRWFFDADAGRFRLKKMYFISNFRLLQSFNGVPCWLGQVLQASELVMTRL